MISMSYFLKASRFFLWGWVFFLFFSCVSTKNFVKEGKIIPKITLKKLRKKLKKSTVPIAPFFARGTIRYEKGTQKITLGVSVVVKRDTMIGMAVSFWGITMAKIKITPRKINYYEKKGGTYFEGGYQKISTLLKTPINFDMLQNIFLAQKIRSDFRANRLETNQKNYHLHYEKKQKNIVLDIWLNGFLRMTKQTILNTELKNKLVLQYEDFKKVGKNYLPHLIKIQAKNATENVFLKLIYKKIDPCKNCFKYKVPAKFKRIH